MRGINQTISGLFYRKEILSVEKFFEFYKKLKIISYVPHKYVEKVSSEMFKAGAGLIGNYEMCSFRTEGTGTYKPNEKANPLSGKRNKVSRNPEIKFEMECDPENLNEVTNALLKHHPYEEIAYEIHDFKKRSKRESGVIVNLKSGLNILDFLKRINKKIVSDELETANFFKRIVVTSDVLKEDTTESARFLNCEYLVSKSNKHYKLFKL